MTVYHMSRDSDGNPTEPGVCTATKKPCPNGGAHSSDQKEIVRAIESELSQKFPTTKRLNKNKIISSMLPTGVLSPARLDADGNEIKPELTYEGYYAGTNKKHFLPREELQNKESFENFLKTPGSQFDPEKVSNIEELIKITMTERPQGLDGDDREKLINMGAYPASFSEHYRYLITPVGGYLGAVKNDQLPPNTELSFYEKIPGSNIVSVTVEMDSKPKVDYGVMILGPRSDPSTAGKEEVEDIFITAHPGLPSVANPLRADMTREEKDEYNRLEHESYKALAREGRMNVAEVQKLKEGRSFNLNVKLRS